MTTEIERQRLRLDLGLEADDEYSLPAASIDQIFEEAAESYTSAASIHAYARVIAIRRLRMQAAAQVDYTQNNSTERASQRFAHLEKILAEWQAELDKSLTTRTGAVLSGRTARSTVRIKEYPGGVC